MDERQVTRRIQRALDELYDLGMDRVLSEDEGTAAGIFLAWGELNRTFKALLKRTSARQAEASYGLLRELAGAAEAYKKANPVGISGMSEESRRRWEAKHGLDDALDNARRHLS